MIKRITFLCILALSGLALQAQDAEVPSVDEILATYFENTGGLEAWKKLNSMKMTGNMSMQGMDFPGTIYQKRPNMQRVEVNVQGKELIQAYDGQTAWWINPFMGSEDPQPMPAEMAEEMTKDQFEDDFIDYAKKGHTVEYVGTEEVEGADCYVLKLTKANGDVEQHFFDMEYMVPIMQRTTVSEGPMKGQASDTFLSDYQEVDGLMVPYFLETKIAGQSIQKITITSIELNNEVEDTMFSMPAKETAPAEDKN
jgi:outer membrane lipoprotein-sorting protein